VSEALFGRPLLPALVRGHADATPDRVSLTSVGQGSVTWRELRDRSDAWAGWLEGHGVRPGDRVVSLVPQSLESAYLWLGCVAAGAVEVSVNSEFRGEWLRHALRASTATLAVVSARYLEHLRRVVADTPIQTVLVYDDGDGNDDGSGNDDPSTPRTVRSSPPTTAPATPRADTPVRPSDLACILYTSGTTGASKPVEVPWGLLHSMCLSDPAFDRPSEQVLYVPYAPYHLSGRPALYRGALCGGHTVVRESFSTGAFWADVREFGCTWTLLYAATARFLAALPERPDDADNPLRRVLMCPLLPETDGLKERFGFDVYSVYGMTEIGSPLVTGLADGRSANAGLCGRPVDWIEARLVDPLDHPVPPGTPGELVLRSAEPWVLTPGYPGAPEATARAWRNGWFHTGDLFTLDEDGNHRYVDRSKDMIRRRGENVSSLELESAVLAHPAVAQAAAVGVPSALGDEEILIAVVPAEGTTIVPDELRAWLRDTVPRYALPRYVRVLAALPRTQSTNRVIKTELRRDGVTPDTWDASSAETKEH
jgi:crotonobetaine/carnitine-CoA ligase